MSANHVYGRNFAHVIRTGREFAFLTALDCYQPSRSRSSIERAIIKSSTVSNTYRRSRDEELTHATEENIVEARESSGV
jgi:hypothetical protein